MPAPANNSASLLPDLDRLQTAASEANTDIAHMRIEKWKADGQSKAQAQANADSLRRNLTAALPGLIGNFRAAPQDLNAGFRLYRNLNALYDVLVSFTESAGAFGPRSEYEALARQVGVIDSVRRSLGDALEGMTSSQQEELNRLRTQIHLMQQQATATPPKKVIVDDTEPPKKAQKAHKKKPVPASSTSNSGSGSNSSNPGGTSAGVPKSQ